MAAGSKNLSGNHLWKALTPLLLTQMVLSVALCFVVLYGGYYFCDCIPVPKSDEDKLTYYIRCCVFPCSVTLYLTIIAVSLKRGQSGAVDPLAGKDHLVQFEKNVLTNTVEQLILFLTITLALTTYLDGAEMKLIPLYSVLWVIGRILFRIGYGINSKYRSFGMFTNLSSSLFFLCVVGYLMYIRGFMYGIPSEIATRVGGASDGTPKAEL